MFWCNYIIRANACKSDKWGIISYRIFVANIHGAYEVHGLEVQLMEMSVAIKGDKVAAFKTCL